MLSVCVYIILLNLNPTSLTDIHNKLRQPCLGFGGFKFEIYNCFKQILMVSSKETLVNKLFMLNEHILSGNNSLRILSTKLKESFVQ